jgi:transposase-like protein
MTTTSVADLSSPVPTAPIQNVPVTVDTKGRVRVSKAQREIILREFERNGVSATQFAQRTGLKYSTLAGWLQRYRRTKTRRGARSVRLLEAVVEAAQPSGAKSPLALVLELPGGARVEIGSVKQAVLAAELLRALAKPC